VSILDPETGCADPDRCTPCAFDHGTGVCVNGGSCELGRCAQNYADCDGKSENGCETHLLTSVENCGKCGVHCGAHAAASCAEGACALGACAAGFADCNHDPADGCEADLSVDPRHCGDCAMACAVESGAQCVKSACVVSDCPAHRGDCNDDPKDGCETDLLGSPEHCGFCRHTCMLANAVAGCEMGECVVAQCAQPFADCDGIASTGCETNTNVSREHCGECNRGCDDHPNGTGICASGVCNVLCDDQRGDCNGNLADGCEVDMTTDQNNCGHCYVYCGEYLACTDARCQ
jgi:hypothetical protein